MLVEEAMTMSLSVFYDSRCPLCAREIRFYQNRYPSADIDWIDLHATTDTHKLPATRETMLRVIHARDTEGNILKGVDAFAAMWKQLSMPWQLMAAAITLPAIRQIAETAYMHFAKRRYTRLYCEI